MKKPLYCIGRVIEIREGYATNGGPKPRVLKLSMEPNPATPSMVMEIATARELSDGLDVGDRIRIDMRKATDEEFEEFQRLVANYQPQAIAAK